MARRQNLREFKRVYSAVVDGKTEDLYLKKMISHERKHRVNINPKIPGKKSLHEQYELACDLVTDSDIVFWIIDLDAVLKETKEAGRGKETALDKLINYKRECARRESKIKIIINNPCIEYWFLLHYRRTAKPFSNCKQVYSDLKEYLPHYDKTEQDIYLRLRPNLPEAISNAKQMGSFNQENPEASISDMWKIFETLDLPDNNEAVT